MSLAFQVAQGFEGLGAYTGINHAPELGGVLGPVPPFAATGNARWTASGYTLVTGWDGTGNALSAPVDCDFDFESGTEHDTIYMALRFKVSSLAAERTICTLGDKWALKTKVTTGKLILHDLIANTKYESTGASVVAGTYEHVAFAVYVNAAGAYQLKRNGVVDASLTDAIADTQSGAPDALMSGFSFDDLTLTVDDVICYAGDGGFEDSDFLGDATRLPHMSTLRPVSQGSLNQFRRCADTFCTLDGAADSTNYQYVDDATCDEKSTWLKSATAGQRESWVMGALSALAGEVVVVQSNIATWFQTASGFKDAHGFVIGGTWYPHTDNANFETVSVGAQILWSSRYWPDNPALRGWVTGDFASAQIGLENQASFDFGVTQALLIVVWLEPLPSAPEVVTLGNECAPCPVTGAAFLDSFKKYNGENSVDGGTTALSSVTITLSGADYDTPGATVLLTASSAIFTAGDAYYVGKRVRLRVGDDEVVIDITDHNAGNLTLDGTIVAAVPASLQAVATTDWAIMVDGVAGLGHLEGEAVYGFLDGVDAGPWTVDTGAVDFLDEDDDPIFAAVAKVGLRIPCEFETLDVDYPMPGKPIGKLQKIINKVFVLYEKSAGLLHIGRRHPDTGEAIETSLVPTQPAEQDELDDEPNKIVTRKKEHTIKAIHVKPGRLYFRHDSAAPLIVNSIEPDVKLEGS